MARPKPSRKLTTVGKWVAGAAVFILIVWINRIDVTGLALVTYGVWELVRTRGTASGWGKGLPVARLAGWLMVVFGTLTLALAAAQWYFVDRVR